ncbi:hypothetical protein M3Y96_00707400 [Aphelenchoides besseyi]|nr:hypothetical protein M3Y96_00707400 [Aphelenchoides besseyi]
MATRKTEVPMYHAYLKGILRGESIDIHELNAQSTESSSDDTIIPVNSKPSPTTQKPRQTSDSDETDDEFLNRGVNLARAHWIQFSKINLQNQVIQQMFINMLRDHPQTRPVWQFTRKVDIDNGDWAKELSHDLQFRHHCNSIQAAFTMLMDNLDEPYGIAKLLQELGNHHFFFDTQESQLELMHEGFMKALKLVVEKPDELPDESLRRSWNKLWDLIKANMSIGISNQRQLYLTQCTTAIEMENVREMWMKVKESGLTKNGTIVTTTALKTYNELIARYKINLSLNIDEHSDALEVTINYYTTERQFSGLPKTLKSFVHNCIVLDVCPTLIRKSFMDGLITMLTQVLGESAMTENVGHLWAKIYRVLEQAILTNIANY